MGDEERIDELEEEEGAAEAQPAGTTDTSKIIKILLFAVGGILVVFLVFGISYLVSKYVQEKQFQRSEDIVVAPPPAPLSHFDLPSFAITTRDEEPHFAKITLSLGYEDNVELNTELVRRTVQMQHLVNIILKGKRYNDLNSVEDTIELSEDIKSHINAILITGKIKDIYFREFVVN